MVAIIAQHDIMDLARLRIHTCRRHLSCTEVHAFNTSKVHHGLIFFKPHFRMCPSNINCESGNLTTDHSFGCYLFKICGLIWYRGYGAI